MSFDLKPEISISILTKSVKEIVWTVSRSPVPPLLAGRVSASTWARTFDMIVGHYAEQISAHKGIMPRARIPFFGSRTMVNMININKARQDSWLEILKSQKEVYQRVGVQVSFAKELSSLGSSRSVHTAGLRFNVGPLPPSVGLTSPPPTKTEYYGSTTITTATAIPIYDNEGVNTTSKNHSIEERLANLHSIQHMITEQEFEKKREEILSQI